MCVLLDKVWVSDILKMFILINKLGWVLYYLRDLNRLMKGVYIVNSDNELIYIDKYYNINKLFKFLKIIIIVM